MTILQALILGVVQGLTEFIPVSSTAHLLLAQAVLGLRSDSWVFSFQVIVQLGTVFAMILFFWRDIWKIIQAFIHGILHRQPFENHQAQLGWLVVVATLPALVIGYLLKDVVETLFQEPFTQAGLRLLLSAFMLTLVEYFGRRNRDLESASWWDAVVVGFFQVLAVFPGASRSGATIAGGMVRGLDRPSAARFAFLMSAPILLAAGAYELIQVIQMTGTRDFLPILAVGFIVAALVGFLAIKWLIGYLSKHSLYVFAAYCAVVGTAALLYQFFTR